MDKKTAIRIQAMKPIKGKVGKVMDARGDNASVYSKNGKEDAIIEAIDQRHTLERHAAWIEKLRDGKIDVPQFFSSVAPDVAVHLLDLALTGSEKARLAAITDLLDRGGFGKVNKHAVLGVDAGQSKEALISLLIGAKKDLSAEGIELVDDDEDQSK